MTCEWVEEQLSAYHDGMLDAAAADKVRAHLATCTHCAAILADYARFDQLLAQAPRHAPAPELRNRIFTSPAFREIMHGPPAVAAPPARPSAAPKPHVSARLLPQAARVWVPVLVLILLLSGATAVIGKILANRATGPLYAACPAALPAGDRLVYQTNGSLFSDNAQLVCEARTHVTRWQVSPTGQWIAYVDATTNTLRLVRANATGDHEVDTDAGAITTLSWSPDGQTLLIVTAAQPQAARSALTFWRVSPTATAATLLGSAAAPTRLDAAPAWSADGQSVALALTTNDASGSQHGITIYGIQQPVAQATANAPDSATLTLAVPAQALGWTTGSDPTLVWATGTSTAITGLGHAARSTLGALASAVHATLLGATAVAFAPATGQWAVAAPDGSVSQIDATSGQVTPLAQIGPVAGLAWSPDGGTLAVTSNGTLWLVTATGATKAGKIDAGTIPAWSPDSTLIAFISNSGAQIYSSTTGAAHAASAGANGTISGLAWSPDGHTLALWGSAGITLDSPAGTVVATIATLPTGAPQWSAA